jgi:hypothetical protein
MVLLFIIGNHLNRVREFNISIINNILYIKMSYFEDTLAEEFADDLPVPDFGRLGRGIAGGIKATDTWAGRMYDRWYPPHLPDADMLVSTTASFPDAELVRTTASFPTKLERERQEMLDDDIANAQDMALGGPGVGGGRTKKKKRTKKRTKKKKKSKKKRSKKR